MREVALVWAGVLLARRLWASVRRRTPPARVHWRGPLLLMVLCSPWWVGFVVAVALVRPRAAGTRA
jgi:hypothetical protein